MLKRMLAIALVFLLVATAWMLLGSSVRYRTGSSDARLGPEVASLWGTPQEQHSPSLEFVFEVTEPHKTVRIHPETEKRQAVVEEIRKRIAIPVLLVSSDIRVDLSLKHRRKGLLWYPTYEVAFRGEYEYTHVENRSGSLEITYLFPSTQASYEFLFEVNGRGNSQVAPAGDDGRRFVRELVPVEPGQTVHFAIDYRTRGLGSWSYAFGTDINRVRNFSLAMTTDFDEIDFPEGTISPTGKRRTETGWRLDWDFENLISGFTIGMEMPQRLNPGPLAARMSFFAPISLGFFFVWIFVISLLRKVDLHPMNYLFLGAAFFCFHLLFANTVDHVHVLPAFLIASAVSVFLVISYLRLVTGLRFALLEAGMSQMVYLVLFSYAHFYKGFTSLIVTVGSIITLFALMQLTASFNWEERLRGLGDSARRFHRRSLEDGSLP